MKWQEHEIAVVTGGGSGLGRALTEGLLEQGARVLIAGRRQTPLEETAALAPDRVIAQRADLSTEEGRAQVAAAVPEGCKVRAVIHNAGVLEPVGPLHAVDLTAWRHAFATNVEAALFLTQSLLPAMQPGSRILQISSGAAHRPVAGWGAYCASKAALFMIYETLRDELRPHGVLVGSVRPGVVDTPMQELIRQQTSEQFPEVERFIKLKERGQLHAPEKAADFVLWALLETGDKQFIEHEWNIADEEQQTRWQETRRATQ
ncbi:short-chain dehydrogenase [Halorhodospira abdelmalekii]|uniref:SDR family oxidoreductase n=1 Tax=Halorhodospira abdelmalekii TaxID=421629 RepID=UPI001905E416|nr:SDR family NAD(P)-dependent oxidoreductase [Halorhodospira abdelmalekii]MBK1734575.1 short-chain dehydrogenase [Halorhodospira abdelmalekii]